MLFILLFAAILPSAMTFAAQPDWVSNQGISSKYPPVIYLTGFGLCRIDASNDKAKALQIASDNAKANLSQKLRVSIQSILATKTEENDDSINRQAVNLTMSYSAIDVEGLENEVYSDDEYCYVLAYAKKENVLNTYSRQIKELSGQAMAHFETAEKKRSAGEQGAAVQEFSTCAMLLGEIQGLKDIAALLSPAGMYEDTAGLPDAQTVAREIQALINKPVASLDDAAWYLSYVLKASAKENPESVMIVPFCFRDTKMTSRFSAFFRQTLENSILKAAGWRVVRQADSYSPKGSDQMKEIALNSGAACLLQGSYWEMGDKIKILAGMRTVENPALVSSAEITIDRSLLEKQGIEFRPQNFKDALIDQNIFNKNEIIDGGLKVETTTNRGNEGLLFMEGDTMNVYVRVNMPCHIRFIYHMSDGKRALLLNDFYIDESKVNQWYGLPGEYGSFICSAPFGSESLQILAQTKEFEPMNTSVVDDIPVITDGLQSIMTKTRGFKKINNSVMQAQSRLVISTMAR